MAFNQVNALEFNEIKAQIKEYLKSQSQFSDYDFEGSSLTVLIDSLAYLLKDNIRLKKEWITIARKHKYFKKVFITPPWEEIYHTDHERKEDFILATKIHSYLIEVYESFNYKPIIVPKTTIQERINFILREIEQH